MAKIKRAEGYKLGKTNERKIGNCTQQRQKDITQAIIWTYQGRWRYTGQTAHRTKYGPHFFTYAMEQGRVYTKEVQALHTTTKDIELMLDLGYTTLYVKWCPVYSK